MRALEPRLFEARIGQGAHRQQYGRVDQNEDELITLADFAVEREGYRGM